MTTLNHSYPAIQGEYEDEFESEYEAELEAEGEDEAFLGGLANLAGSLLGEGEFEDEDESEYEGEYEGEYETEAEYEFEFEAEAEAELESESELEAEFEAEAEEEAEGFVNPVRRVYRDAELMAHLATQASQADREDEGEAFIGALIPLAAKLIPRAASLIARHGPTMLKKSVRMYRRLNSTPQSRRMIKAIPVVLQRTAQSLADQAASGRPIDTSTVVRTLDTMTGRVLSRPAVPSAVRSVEVFNRRWHRRNRWLSGRRRRVTGPVWSRGPVGPSYPPPSYPPRAYPARRRPQARYSTRPAARRVRRR